MSSQVPGDTEDLRDRSMGELLKQLSEQTTRLVHQELELAKAELTQKGRQAGAGVGLFGGAGALGLAALGALTACFILALDAVMPAWLAALLVAVVYGIIAFVLVKQGQARIKRATPLVPEQTIETVKEDVQWAKTQTRSAKTSRKPELR
jgi:Flp pilus assembly protein TadB